LNACGTWACSKPIVMISKIAENKNFFMMRRFDVKQNDFKREIGEAVFRESQEMKRLFFRGSYMSCPEVICRFYKYR
jgi:hypothetical protein